MASKTFGGYLSSVGKKSGALTVDKIWYSFPVGDNHTIFVGPKIVFSGPNHIMFRYVGGVALKQHV